jgi:hypothetical protein
LFSVVVPRRHTPAADACYYNDYDFYDLTARKSAQRRRCERSARLHFIQKEKPIVFAVLECFSRKPARALAKATWTEIGHRKGQGKERKGKGRGGNGRKRKMAFHPNCFWRKKLYEFWDYFLDAGWQGAAKGAETFVLCSFRWPGRRSVGLRSTVTTPRDRVCACTDSGSLNNTENEDGVATICFTINYSRDGCWRRF